MGTLSVLIADQAEEKDRIRIEFRLATVFCLCFYFLSRNKRDRRERKREKGNFIISQTTAWGSFWMETKL
jgi:hypothetical protein